MTPERDDACEICFLSPLRADKDNNLLVRKGGHVLCQKCYKSLRIWKPETIRRHQERINSSRSDLTLQEVFGKERQNTLRKLIYYDITLERINQLTQRHSQPKRM